MRLENKSSCNGTAYKKVATEARCMKELRAELDGNVGLVGNTSATFRYLMHIDSVGLMSLMS